VLPYLQHVLEQVQSISLKTQACLQKCSFHVDYKVDSIDREFGTVIIERDGTQMDLSMEVVKAGWAKVRNCAPEHNAPFRTISIYLPERIAHT
jgi:hypothetical protein